MEAAGSTGRRDDVIGAFQADVVAVLRRPGDRGGLRDVGRARRSSRTAPGWPRWSSSWRPSCRSRRAGTHARGRRPPAAAARRRGAPRRRRGASSPRRPLAVLHALAGQPRPRGRPAASCWPPCPSGQPPAPSTPSRWRSPGSGPRSAPGPCRPWSSAATGWRSHERPCGWSPSRTAPGCAPATGSPRRSPPPPGAGSACPRSASYVELCAPLFASVVRSLERAVGGGAAAALHRPPRPPRPAGGDAARVGAGPGCSVRSVRTRCSPR